jgi:hypothetical protein
MAVHRRAVTFSPAAVPPGLDKPKTSRTKARKLWRLIRLRRPILRQNRATLRVFPPSIQVSSGQWNPPSATTAWHPLHATHLAILFT